MGDTVNIRAAVCVRLLRHPINVSLTAVARDRSVAHLSGQVEIDLHNVNSFGLNVNTAWRFPCLEIDHGVDLEGLDDVGA